MKIIAYRRYNPTEKKFVFSGSTPMMLSNFFEHTATLDTVHKMMYQQFTGLSDKTDSWIYEGDILRIEKFNYEALPKEEMELLKKIYPDEERWNKLKREKVMLDGSWEVKSNGWQMYLRPLQNVNMGNYTVDKKCMSYGFGKLAQTEYKIIGNIYEHPTLLDNKEGL